MMYPTSTASYHSNQAGAYPSYPAYSYPYASNTTANTSGSNNNNSSTSAYANSSTMKKPIPKYRSFSEMLTGALHVLGVLVLWRMAWS